LLNEAGKEHFLKCVKHAKRIWKFENQFEKDSAKLPVQFQNQLSRILEEIIIARKLSKIYSCKKMTGYKNA